MTQRPKRERGKHKSDDEVQPSLRFNVSTLLQEAIGNRRYYDVLDAPIDLEGETASVSGPVDMMRTDGSILVTAKLALTVQEACSICLDSFGLPLELELRMCVEDSPSAAGNVLDAVRYMKFAMDRGIAGVVDPVSSLLMKATLRPISESAALAGLRAMIEQ